VGFIPIKRIANRTFAVSSSTGLSTSFPVKCVYAGNVLPPNKPTPAIVQGAANKMLLYSFSCLLPVADPKNFQGGGRQFISSVLFYRKCTQQNVCLLHKKVAFWKEYETTGGGGSRPTVPPPWIRHCLLP